MSETDGPRVRIGLIGAGAIMRLSHAPVIRRSTCADSSPCSTPIAARAEALAAELAAGSTRELEALLAAPRHRRRDRGDAQRGHPEARAGGGRGRQARVLREAAGDRRRRRAADGRGLCRGRRRAAGRLQPALLGAGEDRQEPARRGLHRRGARASARSMPSGRRLSGGRRATATTSPARVVRRSST